MRILGEFHLEENALRLRFEGDPVACFDQKRVKAADLVFLTIGGRTSTARLAQDERGLRRRNEFGRLPNGEAGHRMGRAAAPAHDVQIGDRVGDQRRRGRDIGRKGKRL